jgi:hypothetical protein
MTPTWCEAFGWFDAYDRMEQTWIGVAIRESLWLFPGIEAVHLLGLAMLGGAVLVVDLRLLGLGLTRLTTRQVSANARPWFIAALVLMFATGIPLFLSEAIKCCFNHSFEVKIAALLLGIVFTFAVRNPVAARGDAPAWMARIVGLVSLGLWFTVAGAGRWIGFSG